MSRWFLIGLVALSATVGIMTGAQAQVSNPVATNCQESPIVAPPSFPRIPQVEAAASPIASPAGPEGLPVDLVVASQIDLVAQSLAACLSAGDAEGVVGLATPEYLGDAFGGGERLSHSDYLALAASAPVIPTRIAGIRDPRYDGMRTVSAEVELVVGNQLRLEQWTFVFRTPKEIGAATPVASPTAPMGVWLVHRAESLHPSSPPGSSRVEATLREYTTTFSSQAVKGPDVVIAVRNSGKEAHELLLLNLQGSTTTDVLLRPTSEGFPQGIAVIGQVSLLPGEQQEMVLVDLRPGTYTAVCLFPDSAGVPHLAFGQEARLTVR